MSKVDLVQQESCKVALNRHVDIRSKQCLSRVELSLLDSETQIPADNENTNQ